MTMVSVLAKPWEADANSYRPNRDKEAVNHGQFVAVIPAPIPEQEGASDEDDNAPSPSNSQKSYIAPPFLHLLLRRLRFFFAKGINALQHPHHLGWNSQGIIH